MKKKAFAIVYIILVLCFIWGQSLLPRTESAQESSFVMEEVVHPVEERLFGEPLSTENQVRKAAHVFEYTMLSIGLAAFFQIRVRERGDQTANWPFSVLSAGILTALIDETIQIFSDRGSLVSDVWVDGIGIVLGILIVWIFVRIRRRRKCTTS